MPQTRLTILDPTLTREFDVPLGVTLIGRETSTALPIPNPQVSRRHAQLVSDGQICELIDLGSANGTFINDERLTPQAPRTLEDGMRLRFGPVEVTVQIIPDPVMDEAPPVGEQSEEQPAEPFTTQMEDGPAAQNDNEEDPGEEPTMVEPAELVLDLPVEPPTAGSAWREPPLEGTARSSGEAPAGSVPNPDFVTAQPLEPSLPEGHDGHDGRDGNDGSQPPRPPSGEPWLEATGHPENPFGLPGLSIYSQHLINQLPGIYQTDFMARFLGIFESIQTPITWTVDSFDLFLDPDSSPADFLSWLGSWFGLTFDASWTEEQRRILISEAHAIFSRRGTRWALARILQIYTGCDPMIVDEGDDIEPFTFHVRLTMPDTPANRTLLTRLIDAHKPAFTTYRLELTP